MGVVRAWRVVHVPARGQISNVSAFVLPEAWPVVDDERQLPMFSDPGRDLLIHVIELQAEGLRLIAAANRELLQNARDARRGALHVVPEPDKEPKAKRRHVPQNKELRDWGSFRAFFQNLERVARHDLHLKPDATVTREQLYTQGGPSPKTITRVMVETYGLTPAQWPPSTWPEVLPER